MPIQVYTVDTIGNGVQAPLGTTWDMYVSTGVTVARDNAASSDDYAVLGTGSNHYVKTDGTIIGGGGIKLGAAASINNKVVIGATGAVHGFFDFGTAVSVTGVESFVENHGTISSLSTGVFFNPLSTGSTSRLVNDGLIEALVGISRLAGSSDTIVIENSGVIKADTALFSPGTARDEFINSGSVTGSIFLGGGNDSYDGASGTIDGTIHGDAGTDQIIGGAGHEAVYGGADGDVIRTRGNNDILLGETGGDTLDGGSGDDQMNGGSGDDTFFVDSNGDKTIEAVGDGNDTVRTMISHMLADNIERLLIDAAGAVNGTGNAAANELNGGAGNNILSGLGDNDTLLGFAGNDTLIGGSGADVMKGGVGNDTYQVDSADTLEELAGEGVDTVISTATRALGANFENLVLATSGTATGTGNALANKIDGGAGTNMLLGGAGNDVLSGFGGKDTLSGGVGNDVLTGGALADRLFGGTGADTFVFKAIVESRGSTSDTIADFSHAQRDKIDLSAIDASTKARGNQAFSFIGDAEFSRKAGELRYEKIGRDTHIQADINGDGKADFNVISDIVTTFVRGDFVL